MLACCLLYPISLFIPHVLMLLALFQKWDLQLLTVLLFFYPRHASCEFSRMPCLFAYFVLCCNFLLLGCLLQATNAVLFARLVVMLLTYLVKFLHILSQCCNILYTTVSYNVLVHLYLGTRKANIKYILINAFVIYGCHKPLL